MATTKSKPKKKAKPRTKKTEALPVNETPIPPPYLTRTMAENLLMVTCAYKVWKGEGHERRDKGIETVLDFIFPSGAKARNEDFEGGLYDALRFIGIVEAHTKPGHIAAKAADEAMSEKGWWVKNGRKPLLAQLASDNPLRESQPAVLKKA